MHSSCVSQLWRDFRISCAPLKHCCSLDSGAWRPSGPLCRRELGSSRRCSQKRPVLHRRARLGVLRSTPDEWWRTVNTLGSEPEPGRYQTPGQAEHRLSGRLRRDWWQVVLVRSVGTSDCILVSDMEEDQMPSCPLEDKGLLDNKGLRLRSHRMMEEAGVPQGSCSPSEVLSASASPSLFVCVFSSADSRKIQKCASCFLVFVTHLLRFRTDLRWVGWTLNKDYQTRTELSVIQAVLLTSICRARQT